MRSSWPPGAGPARGSPGQSVISRRGSAQMTAVRRGAVTAGLGAVVLALASCGSGGGGGGGGSAGGTLKVVGSSDVDPLDPSSVYTTWGNMLARQFARTLFGFKAADNFDDAIKVQPDVAQEIPTTQNGGLS